MSKLRELGEAVDPVRVSEEQQGKNPLAGAFEITKSKTIKLREEKLSFDPICTTDENGKAIAYAVTVNDHHAGELYHCHRSRKWYSLGLKQTHLDGKDKADKVGASPNFDQALKTMLKLRWPQEFKAATAL